MSQDREQPTSGDGFERLEQVLNRHMYLVWEATAHCPWQMAMVLGISRGRVYRWIKRKGLTDQTRWQQSHPKL